MISPLPPLRALQVFETVGHSQSIQEAARRLGISAGAVSQQLQILEQHLHIALFFKEGRRLQLTAAGVDFHQRCSHAFELLRDAQMQLQLDNEQRTLHLSALPSFLNDWLLPRLQNWQNTQSPPVQLFMQGSHHEPDYAHERVDFRFTYAQNIPHNMHWIELFTDQVIPVCHPHWLKTHRLLQPEDLLKLPLISVDWQPRFSSPPSWQDWFKHYAPSMSTALPPSYQRFNLSHQALHATCQGLGVMLAQHAYVKKELEEGHLHAPFPDYSLSLDWPYIMTWYPHVFNKSYARAFHHFILSTIKKDA